LRTSGLTTVFCILSAYS